MPPVGFEPANPATQRPQTHAHATTGIGNQGTMPLNKAQGTSEFDVKSFRGEILVITKYCACVQLSQETMVTKCQLFTKFRKLAQNKYVILFPSIYIRIYPCRNNLQRSESNHNNTTVLKPFNYQLMHIMLKNTELLKHSKITLQHVSVYAETIFRELQSVLG